MIPIFKIRASQCGKIMGGTAGLTDKQKITLAELQEKPTLTDRQKITLAELIAKRDAKPELLAGAKTYCEEWLKQQVYNRTKEYSNKYTEKGNICEPESIAILATIMDYGEIQKNEEYAENDWMTGTCDLNLHLLIEDVKNSWNPFTFPLFADALPDSDYYWQGQVYMCLYGKDRYAVNYLLINAPEELIDREARSVSYKAGYDEVDMELYDEVRQKMTYDDVPLKLRHRRFEFDRNNEQIEQIKVQVGLCREYIQSLIVKWGLQ